MKLIYVNLAGIWTNISEIENVTINQREISTWFQQNIEELYTHTFLDVVVYGINYHIHISQIQVVTK